MKVGVIKVQLQLLYGINTPISELRVDVYKSNYTLFIAYRDLNCTWIFLEKESNCLANENTTKNKDSEIILLTRSHKILQKEIDANFLEINNFHMDSSNKNNEEMSAR